MAARVRSVLFASAKFFLRFRQTSITSTFFSYNLLGISHLLHDCRYLSSITSPFQDVFEEWVINCKRYWFPFFIFRQYI
jgi:hypothetical protein